MDFSRTMLSLAMESGEVQPDMDINNTTVDADEMYEELLYAAEARGVELLNAVTFGESLEALANGIEGGYFTQESFEQYQGKLNHLMLVHNFSIPVETMSASFEAAAADAGAVKEKSNGVVAKVAAWIREKWEAFIKALRRLRVLFKARGAKAKLDQDGIEAKWKENPNNVNQDTYVKGSKSLPTEFISGGKFDQATAIHALAAHATSSERTNVMSYHDASGKVLIPADWAKSADSIRAVGENLKKEVEADRAKKLGEDFKKKFLHGTSSDYEYKAKDVLAFTRWLAGQVAVFEKTVINFDNVVNDMERSLISDAAAMAKDPTMTMALRSVSTRALVLANGITSFLSIEQATYLSLHGTFKSMTGIKGVVEKKEESK